MGKTKNKNRSEIEFVIGENKKLKKEVKQLRRLVEKMNPSKEVDDTNDCEDTVPKVYLEKKTCNNCGKGEVTRFEIVGRIYETCGLCGDRKKIQ